MGGIDIVVPDDITVIVSGIGFMGAFEDTAHVQGPPGAPVVRINGVALMGGVEVHRPKKKRQGRDRGLTGRRLDPWLSRPEFLENTPDTLAWTNPAAPCTAGWSATLELHRLICSYRSRPARDPST